MHTHVRRICLKTFLWLFVILSSLAIYFSYRQLQVKSFRTMFDDASIDLFSFTTNDVIPEQRLLYATRQEPVDQSARGFALGSTNETGSFLVVHSDHSAKPEFQVPHLHQASEINNAMDRELEADEIAEDFGERMEGLFRDKGADEMVRNFAMQHLERFAQERTVRGTWDVDSEEAEKVRAALEDAALEVDNSIGGTAMLALARLSEIDPHVDRRRLSSRSASLVANPSARLSTRIAAAQLCGLLRVRSALPALLSLSADSSVPTPLRLAADHAAGLVSESR